jgi:hypothetical protein
VGRASVADGGSVPEYIGLGWTIFASIASSFVTALSVAWRLGSRLQSFATKDELDKYVTKESHSEFKSDVKQDIHDLRKDIKDARMEIISEIRGASK